MAIKTGSLTDKGLVISQYGNISYLWGYNDPDAYYESGAVRTTSLTEIPFDAAKVEKRKMDFHYGNVMVGADPEIFVVDKKGIIVPAFTFLPTKKESKPFGAHASYSGSSSMERCYNDGFQAEFAINPVACLSWGIDATHRQLGEILKAAKKVEPTARLCTSTALEIPEALLMMAPEEHVRIGCAPSLNAYGDRGEEIVDGRALPYRFAGTHMHFGSEEVTPDNAPRIVKALDAIVGCMSIALFGNKEEDVRRRFYGLRGEYRLPKHGLEYRVVSAQMLAHPVYMNLLFDVGRYTFRCGISRVFEVLGWFDDATIKKAINESDVKAARHCLRKNKALIKQILDRCYGTCAVPTKFEKIWPLLMGKSKLKTHRTVEANWYIDTNAKWINHGEAANCSVSKAIYV